MGGVQAFFEEMAMVIIGGCCAAAWMSSFIFINLFGIGECPVISGIIGAALGIGSLFILPIDVMWLSMVIAAVVTLIAGIIIDKAFYVQTKDLPKASSSSAPVQQAQPSEWICGSCGNRNTPEAKFCRSCGSQRVGAAAPVQAPQAVQAVGGEWTCSCGNVNTPEAKFCRKCGAKSPVAAQSVQVQPGGWECKNCGNANDNTTRYCRSCGGARDVAAVVEKPKGDGSAAFIVSVVVALIGILINVIMVFDRIDQRGNLSESMRQHGNDVSWYELDKIEYDFITATFIIIGAAIAAYILMVITRKLFFSLILLVTTDVMLFIYFKSWIDRQSPDFNISLALVTATVVLGAIYSFKSYIWIWILQLGAAGGASYFIYASCSLLNMNDEMVTWAGNLIGCTILMLILAISNKRRKAFRAAQAEGEGSAQGEISQGEKVENTQGV